MIDQIIENLGNEELEITMLDHGKEPKRQGFRLPLKEVLENGAESHPVTVDIRCAICETDTDVFKSKLYCDKPLTLGAVKSQIEWLLDLKLKLRADECTEDPDDNRVIKFFEYTADKNRNCDNFNFSYFIDVSFFETAYWLEDKK